MSKRLFEAAKHADLYAKYRPNYGEDIYERICSFCRDGGNCFKLAVDVGCGSGQSTKHLTRYFKQFYWGTLKGYWDDKRNHINTHYREFSLPYQGFFRDETLKISKEWTVDQFVGYLASWSGWQSYLKAHPSASDLENIRHSLAALYKTSTGEEFKVNISWPVFMLLGRKPKD